MEKKCDGDDSGTKKIMDSAQKREGIGRLFYCGAGRSDSIAKHAKRLSRVEK